MMPLVDVIKQVDYQYDALGRRMQKSVWDKNHEMDPKKTYVRKYIYDGDNVLAEYDQSNNLIARYTYSPIMPDDILEAEISFEGVGAGLAQSAGKYYYLKDALGSVTDVISGDGNIIQRYDYEAFGKIRSIKTADGIEVTSAPLVNTSYTYTGREWDEEAGLYYYRARYYDPQVGRFLQKDRHPGRKATPISVVNQYAYANNSPLVFTDPSGEFVFLALFIGSLFSSSLIGATAAAIIAGSLGALAAIEGAKYGGSTEKMFKEESAAGLLGIAVFGALGGWVGQIIKGAVTSSTALLGVNSTVVAGLAGGAGSAGGTLVTTGLLDVTNITNPEASDYANGMLFGAILGGSLGILKDAKYIPNSIATPVGAITRGGYRYYMSYPVPDGDKNER